MRIRHGFHELQSLMMVRNNFKRTGGPYRYGRKNFTASNTAKNTPSLTRVVLGLALGEDLAKVTTYYVLLLRGRVKLGKNGSNSDRGSIRIHNNKRKVKVGIGLIR